MFQLPNPLHPAIVHFPIALILVGTLAAVLAVFVRRTVVLWFAAALLTLGAAGAYVALETGEDAEKAAKPTMTHAAHELVEEHSDWAERTLTLAIPAALAAIAAAFLTATAAASELRRRLAPGARTLAALLALIATFCVYQTARRGGELVYTHGTGVHAAADAAAPAPAASEQRHDDDDD